MDWSWEQWKRPIRNHLKYSKSLLRGYPFSYTRQQNPEQADQYPYLWGESVTPIPDRGSPEIRQNRIWNLQLAASRINYLRLDPQKIFSFCDRVGEPTLSNGFRAGPVFVRGEVSTGVGGGLCLLATNVFNTFLGADCQILERHCHSIDAYGEGRFYQLGQDAAVAYGYKDLIVRNSSPVPLQIRFQVLPEVGKVTSSLWGKAPCQFKVKLESTVLQEIPAPAEDGISGWIIKTVRYVRDRPNPDPDSSIDSEAPETLWHPNYHATSIYQPCTRS
ncbi:MAG: VanW family protein [Leptolyngbyaceae bacterium]|nr:VanW family protein [Leptolyngbyaceae bacterium]